MDNSEPSANGTSALNLNRLASILEDEGYRKLARSTVDAFEAEVLQHPFLFTTLLSSVVAQNLGMKSIQVIGSDEEADKLAKALRRNIGANGTITRLGGENIKSDWLKRRNELLKTLDTSITKVTVCEAGACRDLSKEELDSLLA